MTHDIDGRPYAKLSELKAGDKVELDSGFTCASGIVELNDYGLGLYFNCSESVHFLEGQLSEEDGDTLIGVYSVPAKSHTSHAPDAVDDGAAEA